MMNSNEIGAQAIVMVGAAVNCGLIALKFAASYKSESAALLAEANHSLFDLIADAVTFLAVRESAKPRSRAFPYGRAKFEAVCAVAIGVVLVAGGVAMAVEITENAWQKRGDPPPPPQPPQPGPATEDEEGGGLSVGGNAALVAALVSLVCKEGLYRVTYRLGERLGSMALMSNACHYRSDALAALVALAGIAGSALGYPFLDPVAGLGVCVMLLSSGLDIFVGGLRPLVDAVEASQLAAIEQRLADAGFRPLPPPPPPPPPPRRRYSSSSGSSESEETENGTSRLSRGGGRGGRRIGKRGEGEGVAELRPHGCLGFTDDHEPHEPYEAGGAGGGLASCVAVSRLRVRPMGSGFAVDLRLWCDPALPTAAAAASAAAVRRCLEDPEKTTRAGTAAAAAASAAASAAAVTIGGEGEGKGAAVGVEVVDTHIEVALWPPLAKAAAHTVAHAATRTTNTRAAAAAAAAAGEATEAGQGPRRRWVRGSGGGRGK